MSQEFRILAAETVREIQAKCYKPYKAPEIEWHGNPYGGQWATIKAGVDFEPFTVGPCSVFDVAEFTRKIENAIIDKLEAGGLNWNDDE